MIKVFILYFYFVFFVKIIDYGSWIMDFEYYFLVSVFNFTLFNLSVLLPTCFH